MGTTAPPMRQRGEINVRRVKRASKWIGSAKPQAAACGFAERSMSLPRENAHRSTSAFRDRLRRGGLALGAEHELTDALLLDVEDAGGVVADVDAVTTRGRRPSSWVT